MVRQRHMGRLRKAPYYGTHLPTRRFLVAGLARLLKLLIDGAVRAQEQPRLGGQVVVKLQG